jgi:hypothetical protein
VELATNGEDGTLAWRDVFRKLSELRAVHRIPPDTFIHLLTTTPNENNWYAVEDPSAMRNAFGHVGDFSWATSAPSAMISAHFVLKALANALIQESGVEWSSLWHENARGCFFDFCQDKADLAFKLRTADICGDCMDVLKEIQVPDPFIAQAVSIMETTRRSAVNTGQYLIPELDFRGWPFPVAITRHKAVQATNPLLRFMLLLDHFDSLVRHLHISSNLVGGRKPQMVDRPSLGWWVDQLQGSLGEDSALRQVVRIAQRDRVVSLRNERRGHGWMAACVEDYSEDAGNLEEILARVEAHARPFLDNFRLVIPKHVGLKEGSYMVEGDALIGSHVIHPSFKLSMMEEPREIGITTLNQVFITDSTMRKFISMDPYVKQINCPECRYPRVLVTDGGDQFIDVFVGHRVRIRL